MKIYYMDISEIADHTVKEQNLTRYTAFLGPEECTKIIRMKQIADKKRSFAAYYLLSRAWNESFENEKHMPVISRNEFGKPYFEEENTPGFNLSHSGRFAVCAFAQEKEQVGNIGVDVQESRKVEKAFMRRFFSEHEYAYALQMGQQGALEIWSRKESLGKCRGYGLKKNLKELDTMACKEHFIVYDLCCECPAESYVLTACTEKSCDADLCEIHWDHE